MPVLESNSNPFYKHLKGSTKSHNPIRLALPDGTFTSDPKRCADMLNSFFYQQFTKYHQLPMLGYEAAYEVPGG